MKTIGLLNRCTLVVGAALYVSAATAQPPLSKLPQASPPAISEVTKQAIRNQFAASGPATAEQTPAEKQAMSTRNQPSMTTLTTGKSDNQANQNAYIADVKRRLTEQ